MVKYGWIGKLDLVMKGCGCQIRYLNYLLSNGETSNGFLNGSDITCRKKTGNYLEDGLK